MMRVEVADRTDGVRGGLGRGSGRRGAAADQDRAGLPGRPRGLRPAGRAGVVPGRADPGRAVGVRGPPDRRRGAADRRGHRSPHHPQRARAARVRPCTWTRAATAARRPSPACTTWAGRPAGWSGCTWTARPTRCPPVGAALTLDGRAVGFVGGSARHYELGPIALGLVKRNIDPARDLLAAGPGEDGEPVIAAAQEVLVDPEVGLHVRPASDPTAPLRDRSFGAKPTSHVDRGAEVGRSSLRKRDRHRLRVASRPTTTSPRCHASTAATSDPFASRPDPGRGRPQRHDRERPPRPGRRHRAGRQPGPRRWGPCSRRCIPAAAASRCRRSAWSGPASICPPELLALVCASHSGEPFHVEGVRQHPRPGRARRGRPADPAGLAGRRAGRARRRSGPAASKAADRHELLRQARRHARHRR